MDSAGTETPLRLQVSSCLRTLSTSRDPGQIVHELRTLTHFLEDGEFTRVHYTRTLQVLVGTRGALWFSGTDEEMQQLWEQLFLRGPPEQTLLVLLDTIRYTGESAALERSVCVLQKFLSSARIQVLLWARCEGAGACPDSPQLREAVIGHLAALPTITSNHLHTNTPEAFLPQQYCPLLAASILDTLEKTCNALRAGQDCSLSFLSQVLGKACIQGYSAQIFETLAPRLSSLTREDPLWQRVTQKLLENVPEQCVECVITGLIHSLSGPAAVSRLMGNLVVTNKKAQFVLTHKLLLQQYQHPTRLIKSVLGYLSMDSERRTLLKQVFRSVCQVWCNSSAVKHTPVEQQLYVSKALLLCVALLHHSEIQELRQEMLHCMLGGVQCRLDSNIERIRRMGMVVGESLSHRLDTPGSQLKFQPITAVTSLEQCDDITHWRQIVEKRIQSKTRRISKGGSHPVKSSPNRFAPVAGLFFFPLLRNYDRPQVTFDLLGGDHLVLGRLLHTLGLIMHLAINAPVASQMGRALLDFVWVVRFHTDQMVRRGVMFSVCSVFLSMPSENLLLELGDELMETRAWLADVAENDCDADCRSLAVQSLILLDKNLKAQLQTPEMETRSMKTL